MAAREEQIVILQRASQVAALHAGLDRCRARSGVDGDLVECVQIDEHAVAQARRCPAVASGARRHLQAFTARKAHGGGHVLLRLRADDHRGEAVGRPLVVAAAAELLVAVVASPEDGAGDLGRAHDDRAPRVVTRSS